MLLWRDVFTCTQVETKSLTKCFPKFFLTLLTNNVLPLISTSPTPQCSPGASLISKLQGAALLEGSA